MAATSIPLDITGHMGQGALALDPTSFDPGNGILHGDTTLVVMCQHHGTFQFIAGSTDAVGWVVGHGKECWKWWQSSLHFMAYDKPGPFLGNQVPTWVWFGNIQWRSIVWGWASMLQASQESSGVAAGQSEVTCHKHAFSWTIFYLWTKTKISKTIQIFRLAPSLPDTGAKCPWASWTTCWFFWSCWLLVSGCLLSSQQMEPSRSGFFMPTWSICFPLLQASWKLNMEPALLLGCTSMQAGVKAWWCWAKPCWTNSLQMESACWLTGTELAWMASTSLCKFAGKAMALL